MPDPNVSYFAGRTVAILGYNADAQEQAQHLREHSVRVLIALRLEDPTVEDARRDGFPVRSLWDAVSEADIIQVW